MGDGTTTALPASMTRTHFVLSLACALAACGPAVEENPADERATSSQDLTLPPLIQLPTAPTITSLSPSAGWPGTVVTITGVNFTNLSPSALRSVYRFENDPATLQVTVVSNTQARFTVPSGAVGGRVCRSSILSTAPTSCTSNAFVVGDPNGRVRLDNRTRADLISARLDNVEVLAPQTLAGGTTRDVYPVTPGTHSYQLAVGFGPFTGPAANRVICNISGSLSVPAATTTPLWVADLTVTDLLGHCGVSTYTANFFDEQGLPRQVTMRFEAAGNRWTFLDGNTVLRSGTVSVVTWNPGSSVVTFRLDGALWPDVTIGFPYLTFFAGPAGAPLLFARTTNW